LGVFDKEKRFSDSLMSFHVKRIGLPQVFKKRRLKARRLGFDSPLPLLPTQDPEELISIGTKNNRGKGKKRAIPLELQTAGTQENPFGAFLLTEK